MEGSATGRSRRYFTREQVEAYIRHQEMEQGISQEDYNLRANVESTIHQVFHRLKKRNKMVYRGWYKCHSPGIMGQLHPDPAKRPTGAYFIFIFGDGTPLWKPFEAFCAQKNKPSCLKSKNKATRNGLEITHQNPFIKKCAFSDGTQY